MIEPAARKLHMIAGWPLARVIAALLLTSALVWAAWMTRTLVELQQRRIVSVSLSRLVEDFVAAEARNGGTPDQSASRTASYLAAVNKAVSELGKGGTTVLVSEATLGRSVDDRTADIGAQVARAMEAEHDPR